MKKKKIIISISMVLFILLFGTGGFYFLKIKNKQSRAVSSAALAGEARKNYFEINDETVGIYFRVSKNFDRMTAQELQFKNPVFIYGFSAKNDKSAYCVVSQTQREKSGGMKAADLRDGVLNEVKKSYPDAVLVSAEVIKVGDNNNGIKLSMNYTDNKIPMAQQEVVGITDKTATFVFCAAPKAVLELCREDFDLFLDSIKIK